MLRHVASVSRGIYPQEKCNGAKRCERDTREGIVSGVCARMHACVRVCAGQVRSRALNWETGTLVEKGGEGEERERIPGSGSKSGFLRKSKFLFQQGQGQ